MQLNLVVQNNARSGLEKINSGRKFYYRIKRGEHHDWDAERVIENELAARVLLAFDLKQPWSCHQTYKLFDELHSDIFGRPEVTGPRIVNTYEIYRIVLSKLGLLENQLFATYSITRFLVLYLLREALEKDETGKEFCLNPAKFLNSAKKRAHLIDCVDKVAQVVVRILDSEVKRRDADPSAPSDFKRELKSPNSVREIRSTIVSHYQIAVDSKLAPTFFEIWKKSRKSAKPRRRKKQK